MLLIDKIITFFKVAYVVNETLGKDGHRVLFARVMGIFWHVGTDYMAAVAVNFFCFLNLASVLNLPFDS
jgi:hypothetical protein